jgi:hypothetical protein
MMGKHSAVAVEGFRSLTPAQILEIGRYWDAVDRIRDHMRDDDGLCGCGESFDDDQGWAEHLANNLFPHKSVVRSG